MTISSSRNPRIKAIRALSQRKKRQETGLFFAEGIRLAGEAVQAGADIETLVVAPELLRSDFGRDTVRRAEQDGVEILHVSADVFQTLSMKDGPQGLGVVVRQRWTPLDEVGPGRDGATPNDSLGWVVLEEVGSPGNLGSILRTCDAVGAAGVILLGDTADPHDPEAVRGSMGAVFSKQVVRTSLEELVRWKRQFKVQMIGTSDTAPVEYRKIDYTPPVLLCLGGEQHGLSEELVEVCDTVVRIPMAGRADSLNLAVAAGVMLYEVSHRKRGTG